eukprot:10843434-Karenia_brevis.AAC.1
MLKKAKCADGNGVVAEMLQAGHDVIINVLLELYNEILKPDSGTPQAWKSSVISVLFKSGEQTL